VLTEPDANHDVACVSFTNLNSKCFKMLTERGQMLLTKASD